MAGLDPEPQVDADVARRYDDARWRAAERAAFEAGLQVWAARLRWQVSQEAARERELQQLERRAWTTIKAAVQVWAERERRLLPQETKGAT